MTDNDRTNEAMQKFIGNITELQQNIDGGQYVPLGFTSATAVPNAANDWQQSHLSVHHPQSQTLPMQQKLMYVSMPSMAATMDFNNPQPTFGYHPSRQFVDMSEFDSNVNNFLPNNYDYVNHIHETPPVHHQAAPILDNMVGNWGLNSRTYTPFGNESFLPTNIMFEKPELSINQNQNSDETKILENVPTANLDDRFMFNNSNRDKKPRMVAEVKPMRPRYSDVLTKAVPKPQKNENIKEKPKKDGVVTNNISGSTGSGKKGKNDKAGQKITRSNTNSDIKEIPDADSAKSNSKSDKKSAKSMNQLNRKWSSLDNINDTPTKPKIIEETPSANSASKKRRPEDNSMTKGVKTPNLNTRKVTKTFSDIADIEAVQTKPETATFNKNGLKKANTSTNKTSRPKSNEYGVGGSGSERPPGKRMQRNRRKDNEVPFGVFGQKLKQYTKGWWNILTFFILWLFNLISDVCSLSLHIAHDLGTNFWTWLQTNSIEFYENSINFLKNLRLINWLYEKFKGRKKESAKTEEETNFVQNGLKHNINMPTTGDEAMKRLLACKGKDPYSILGVTPTCTDDDIKKYYKRQAFLVHPDKNQQPGAEEAFKILVHAFDMIGEPERRASYDRGVMESAQVVQAWSELNELLQQLQQKVEAAANTIRCSACGLKHKRIKVDRPSYAARNCNSCKIHHSAREGDIWAEARVFGFLWHYYACMEGAVYDITEWAGCQKESLKHLKPDSHQVQYRIALGKQNNQPRRHSGSPRSAGAAAGADHRPDLENLLNSLYGQAGEAGQQSAANNRRRNKKAK